MALVMGRAGRREGESRVRGSVCAVGASIVLACLTGCGSCLDDKKVPEAEPSASGATVVMKPADGGRRRPLVVGEEGTGFARALARDGGLDGGG
jgi:hypothetical protein